MISKIKKLFTKKQKSIYQIIGEEKGCLELVKNFYEFMETSPKALQCLEVHERDVDGSVPDIVKKKLFMFLCGWFGGPNLFVETYGHPRMRARHGHIKISEIHKDQWMLCMRHALDNHSYKIKKKDFTLIYNSFLALSMRIQNQAT